MSPFESAKVLPCSDESSRARPSNSFCVLSLGFGRDETDEADFFCQITQLAPPGKTLPAQCLRC